MPASTLVKGQQLDETFHDGRIRPANQEHDESNQGVSTGVLCQLKAPVFPKADQGWKGLGWLEAYGRAFDHPGLKLAQRMCGHGAMRLAMGTC